MSPTQSALERVTRLTVTVIRLITDRRTAASVAGLVAVLVVATTFIVGGSLRINPLRSTITVRVLLRDSGGLLPKQNVTLRGVPIGRVDSISFTDDGVLATAQINTDAHVPQNSLVRVSPLSPAGEQYLDFRPQQAGGPALRDGSVIHEDRTAVPVSLAQLLADGNGLLAQLDPKKLAQITDEMRVGTQGPAKLAALLDGGAFLISTLDSVLPQTMSVLRTSRTVATTLADGANGLNRTSHNMQRILQGVGKMDGGFRALLDRGRRPLTAVDQTVDDNSNTMIQLLGNLTTTAQMLTVRVPALTEMLNAKRDGSALAAMAAAIHDGYFWAIVDIYPRYACDYKLPRLPQFLPDYPEPYRYTFCDNPDPAVLIRGARNAPRPPGDDTAGPPPGYDPLTQTDPTPPMASLIPTPFGGPKLPYPLPPDPPDWPVPPGWPGKPK